MEVFAGGGGGEGGGSTLFCPQEPPNDLKNKKQKTSFWTLEQ